MRFANFLILFTIFTLISCTSASEEIEKRAAASRDKHAENGAAAPDGMSIFRKNCVACHGADGKLGLSGAKDLSASELPLDARIQIITNGKNLMTPFKALLSEAEIKAVAEYTLTLQAQSAK